MRALLLLCIWAVHGVQGLARASEPAKTALLWVPESTTDYDGFMALMSRFPNARLTVALASEEVPEGAKPGLMELVKKGRLELATRIAGDPILPLVMKYRPRDVSYRLAVAKETHRRAFVDTPAGFVPGGGALTPQLAEILRGQHLRWAAVGPSSAPWTQGEITLVPFVALNSTAAVPEGPALLVEDVGLETNGLELLAKLFASDKGGRRWTTVTDALPSWATAPPPPSGSWPTFGGGYSLWAGDPLQDRAWSLYSSATEALTQYENSGRAGLSSLDKALSELYAAQASRFFRLKSLRAETIQREFRAHLQRVFQITAQPIPDELIRPLAQATAGQAQGGDVKTGAAKNELWFENPEDSLAQAPELPPGLTVETASQDLWTIRSLKIQWDDKAVTFAFAVGRLLNLQAAPAGFSPLMLDLYIDMNHMPGQGATSLMPGRRGFLQPRDAWEYALVVTGWGAGMYRAGGMEPVLVQDLVPKAEDGLIKVSVPRSKLRGNPARWGYLVLAFGVSPEAAQKNGPALPLPGRSGSPVLSLLGPLDSQRAALSGAASYRRFSMLRQRAN